MSRQKLAFGFVLLACGTFILCATAADPKKPSKSAKPSPQKNEPTPAESSSNDGGDQKGPIAKADASDDQGPWEVTDRVELIYKEKLTVSGDKTLTAKVKLKNKSDSDIAGKLLLVIDGSTIAGTKLIQPNGQFTETTPYIQITPAKRKLESGDESPVKTLILNSETSIAELEEDVKKAPELRWRAFTMTKPEGFETEPPADDKSVPGKSYTWGEMRQTMTIQEKFTEELFTKHPGDIVGTATSENADGQPIVLVYASRGGMSRKIPGTIDGISVEVQVTGTIKAGPAQSGVVYDEGKAVVPPAPVPEAETSSGKSTNKTNATIQATQAGPPTRRFNRPVPIGVSTINQTDECASGTLGCRCIDSKKNLYVLSNNHVFSKQNAGLVGQAICQPSTGDSVSQCTVIPADVIATLYDFQKVGLFTTRSTPINVMDAAIGLTTAAQVDSQTWTPGYGTPSRFPQENVYPGLLVQKCGRTTGFTKGKIKALNAEVTLAYSTGTARFKGCISVESQFRFPTFSAGGDSGSLVVTQADRRPVGLLYAGGGFTTFLNPISPILNRFKVGVDDGTGSPPVMGSGRMGAAVGPVNK